MLFDDQAEHRLAFKISASILAILVVVAFAISGVFYVLKQQGDREVLGSWLSLVISDATHGRLLTQGSAEDLDEFYSRSPRIPAPFRNIIIHFDGGDFHVYGPLALAETEELQLGKEDSTPLTFNRDIAGRRFFFYGNKLADRTIYVYASQDGELGHFSKEVLSIVLACLLFTIGLYFVARRIAKRSFAPLHESLAMMGLYNRNIAHELRTPLAVLKSDLELASQGRSSEHIPSALEEVSSMEKIIDGLLFLAENRSTGERASVKPADILAKKWELLERKYPDRCLTLDMRLKSKLEGNSELITILFGVLLENAFVHAKDGTTVLIRQSVEGITLENEAEHPIPDSVLGHIFEPFIKFNSGGS